MTFRSYGYRGWWRRRRRSPPSPAHPYRPLYVQVLRDEVTPRDVDRLTLLFERALRLLGCEPRCGCTMCRSGRTTGAA